MRLGGPIFNISSAEEWILRLKDKGYTAAYCPVEDPTLLKEYSKAAADNNIIIAEIGVWNNLLDPDPKKRKSNIDLSIKKLNLADETNIKCCVNISGSRGDKWDGPHPKNLTRETFDMVVETTRKIIDSVNPKRAFYTLEPMPWMYPDTAENYERLLKAVDRKMFGVHFDPVNMIASPYVYFNNSDFIKDFVRRLGPHIKSCHAKDTKLGENLTVHLDEVRPGLGNLDYVTLLKELNNIDLNMPVMLEHLTCEKDYDLSAKYIRFVADNAGVEIV